MLCRKSDSYCVLGPEVSYAIRGFFFTNITIKFGSLLTHFQNLDQSFFNLGHIWIWVMWFCNMLNDHTSNHKTWLNSLKLSFVLGFLKEVLRGWYFSNYDEMKQATFTFMTKNSSQEAFTMKVYIFAFKCGIPWLRTKNPEIIVFLLVCFMSTSIIKSVITRITQLPHNYHFNFNSLPSINSQSMYLYDI